MIALTDSCQTMMIMKERYDMGIYIKNMKKPKHCGCCKFTSAFDCRITGEFIEDHNQILDSCPIVEIPTPHGNLKDEDYILKEMEYYAVDYYDVYVRHAPTIIESEE